MNNKLQVLLDEFVDCVMEAVDNMDSELSMSTTLQEWHANPDSEPLENPVFSLSLRPNKYSNYRIDPLPIVNLLDDNPRRGIAVFNCIGKGRTPVIRIIGDYQGEFTIMIDIYISPPKPKRKRKKDETS